MAKKGNDINLFKAASKADKKIQTGVSKGFLGIIAIAVVCALGALYVGNIFVTLQTVKTEISVYAGYESYSTGVNALANQVQNDKDLLASIQADIDAANAIKYYAYSTSILYPGLTNAQKALVLSDTYVDQGITKPGCVPNDVDMSKGIKTWLTNGIDSISIIKTNDQDQDVYQNAVFEKGYLVIMFESEFETVSNDYVNNILARASNVFAKEAGQPTLSAASFETGYISKPNEENSNYVMYIKCKLKSVIQIIMEDEYINYYLVNDISSISFTGTSLFIELRTQTAPLYVISDYLYYIGLFKTIGYTGEERETVGDHYEYKGTIICGLKEVSYQ